MFKSRKMLKGSMAVILVLLLLAIPLVGALAASTGNTGQPSQSCEDQPMRPGNAISAPGSAFNPDGLAGTKYAGTQPQNTINSQTNSQYDVACFQVSTNH